MLGWKCLKLGLQVSRSLEQMYMLSLLYRMGATAIVERPHFVIIIMLPIKP
jgi:hypothetical protein